ncbi:MAG: aldo/keto reductase [Muribaculaceae bacterium]|nr:aldo/keto reductase [Muribaculaceae bacterium]
MKKSIDPISRRSFIKKVGAGGAAVAVASLTGCKVDNKTESITTGTSSKKEPGEMTYRETLTTGDKVSILGYGCMRWPTKPSPDDPTEQIIDQDAVNELVDYAMKHGVNYYDTSPVYCKGESERVTGIALSRYPRDSYFIATKASNFNSATWPREESIAMYRNSMKYLQTDYIDYYLLHSIGQNGMEAFNNRYINNGFLDFLLAEREAGRIRNLGFSYHGDIEVFDYLLANHDKYKWDFVQIQLNYVDWNHASGRNTNASYLYDELDRRNIPAVIMEPLLGGRLADMPDYLATRFKERRPEDSLASWAFRYAGTHPRVLTVLSGMTYMEHLVDNLATYSPLEPCTAEELDFLEDVAKGFIASDAVPCTACQYCMPCPFGIDIPAVFGHYNKMVNDGTIDKTTRAEAFNDARRKFLVGYDRSVPRLRQANHCIGCHTCEEHCPQSIKIAKRMHKIDSYVEKLKRGEVYDAEA